MKTEAAKIALNVLERIARRNVGLKIRRKPRAAERLDIYKVTDTNIPRGIS